MRYSGADHGLERLVHQVSGALKVDRSQHCKVQQEKGPEAAKCPSQMKQEGSRSTSESAAGFSEITSELHSVSVRWIAMGLEDC